MVRYISQYNLLVQIIHASDSYQNATKTERQGIDKWLNRDDVRKYFGSRVVPQLTFHESFVLGFANSDALQQRTPEDQQKVMKYVKSDKFENYLNNFENSLNNLEGRINKSFGVKDSKFISSNLYNNRY